jgi:UDP-N-acetylglucosamine 2-epimerase (hydrolysing)
MKKRTIAFLTGTRADFGKLKSLIEILVKSTQFDVHIFATGMHMDMKYGYTVREIEKCSYKNIYKYINHDNGASTDITLSRTIEGFANYIHLLQPDLIVVHGDRIEALSGAIVGALNNIIVAHIEGGEISGTVDELIRHSVSKLSHTHFVANEEAKKRLQQMGERSENIYIIGSPDIDVMLSENMPSWESVKKKYEIPFNRFAVSMFHPVTTEVDNMDVYCENYISALEESDLNYIVIYPNNDKGSDFILNKIKRLQNNPKFRVFPSIRFEAFLVLLKHATFMAGNSSAGIREAPFYGIPTVNVGTRQNGRTTNPDIIHTDYDKASILLGLQAAVTHAVPKRNLFGDGKSYKKFLEILSGEAFWNTSKQKLFADQPLIEAEEIF